MISDTANQAIINMIFLRQMPKEDPNKSKEQQKKELYKDPQAFEWDTASKKASSCLYVVVSHPTVLNIEHRSQSYRTISKFELRIWSEYFDGRYILPSTCLTTIKPIKIKSHRIVRVQEYIEACYVLFEFQYPLELTCTIEVKPYETEYIIVDLQMTRWVEWSADGIVLRDMTWETQPTESGFPGIVQATKQIMKMSLANWTDKNAIKSSTAKVEVDNKPGFHLLLPITPLYETTPPFITSSRSSISSTSSTASSTTSSTSAEASSSYHWKSYERRTNPIACSSSSSSSSSSKSSSSKSSSSPCNCSSTISSSSSSKSSSKSSNSSSRIGVLIAN